MRIAIAGFQHETNTFAPMLADLAAFERAGAWPGLTQGEAVRDAVVGINLSIAGFIAAAEAAGHEVVPIVWCSAEPSSFVTDEAFDTVTTILTDGLTALCADSDQPLDAVYLDLHGAMVTQSYQDGEGEVLTRVRRVIGMQMPLAVSLDLHVNLTAKMVELADVVTIYRTYPHLDMAATGARCLPLLERILEHGKPAKAFAQVPFMVPLQAQYTYMEPNTALYGLLEPLVAGGAWSADIASGFPPADIYDAGPAVVAYGGDQDAADAAMSALLAAYIEAESSFDPSVMEPAEAVRNAMQQPPGKPMVLADVEDNPGAGATSDTTGMLNALVDGKAQGAVLALLYDPDVAEQAHTLGVGAQFSAALGGKCGGPGDGSFAGRFEVLALSDGRFPFTGQMYAGAKAELGSMALLRVVAPGADVRVVVGAQRCQCLDQAIFRHIGVDLDSARIVVVKSTVHFRADFEPIAQQVWTVRAPGAHPSRLDTVDYKNLRPGVRLGPNGPAFARA
jgi:microcystin degradation protein MlrC